MGPLIATCPGCRIALKLPQPLPAGTPIKCGKCGTTFPLTAPTAPVSSAPAASVPPALPPAKPVGPAPAPVLPAAGPANAVASRPGMVPMAIPVPANGSAAPAASMPGASLFEKITKKSDKRIVIAVLAGVAVLVFLTVGLAFVVGVVYFMRTRSVRSQPVALATSKAYPPAKQPVDRIAKFQEPEPPRPGQPSPVSEKKRAWLKRTLPDAYERIGRKNPNWDPAAREFLQLTAEAGVYTHPQASSELDPLAAAYRKATQAGCDDPIVLAAAGRIYDNTFRHDLAAQKMENSQYHAVHRAHAMVKAVKWHYGQPPGDARTQQINRHLDAAVKLLPEIVKDKEVPASISQDLLRQLQETYRMVLNNDRKAAFDKINAELEKAAPNSTVVCNFQGEFYIKHAWDARGSGFANTVTDDGWKVFTQRLAQAQTSLENAWQLDSTNTDAATNMLTVELGQGQGRDRMEAWYKRAMAADPDNYAACSHKLYYLEPKWHGSEGEMLQFARECIQTGNWKARLPLIMVEAHEALARYNRNNPNAHFERPDVWADLKSVFEPYLKQFPKAARERSRYALFACRAGQWDEANRQFAQLGQGADLAVFQGPQNLEQLRKEAASKAKPIAQGK